jgi:anti-anti-sigma factor
MSFGRTMPFESSLTFGIAGRGTPDVVLRLVGMLSRDPASRALERSVEEQQRDGSVRRIHLDLRGLRGIDLEGVAVLARAYQGSKRRGKSLTVEGATGPVRRRLLTTGILRLMEPPGFAATAS